MFIEIFIALAIFLVSYFLIVRNFKTSLYVLMILSVLVHKELFSIYRWDLLPVRAFMLALFCAGITKIYFWFAAGHKKEDILKVIKDPYIVLLFFLWFIRGLSIIFTKNIQASLLMYGFFTTIVALVIFLVLNLKGKKDEVLKYLKFYIYVVFGLTLFGYFQYLLYIKTGTIIGAFWNIPGNVARVGATFWDVNHYGALLAALLPVLGVLILTEGTLKKKIFYSFMFLSMFATLFLTNSRTAWIIDGVALLTFASLFLFRKIGVRGFGYVFLALALFSIPLAKEYSNKDSFFRAKVKQYFHYRMDSFDSHFMLLTGTYQIFEQYPILGGGYGSFFEHFSKTAIAPTYFGRDPAALNTRVPAHTIWGELIAETGVLGLSTFLLFIFLMLGVLFYNALKNKNTKESLLSLAMGSVITGWCVGGVFYSYNAEFFWILITLFFIYGVSVLDKKISLTDVLRHYVKDTNFLIISITILSAFLIFLNLGKNHLIPWDEAIYAKIAKNMVQTHEYITMYWNPQVIWYEKPPLFMWLASFFMKLFGFGNIAVKLPSALFGLSTVLLIFIFGKRLFNKTVAFIASFTLITTIHFLYYSRIGMTDITTTFFITLSLFLYYFAKEKDKIIYWILSGIALGFAVMTKGVVGFLPLVIMSFYELYLLISRQQKLTKKILCRYIYLFISSTLIFLPWHIVMYQKYGMSFLKEYIGYHVLSRAVSEIEDKGKPFLWYVVVLKVSMRLWFITLLGALPLALFKSYKKDKRLVFLSIWMLVVFFFFSLAKSKLVWYIIPIYPVAALINGFFLERVLNFIMEKIHIFNNVVFKSLALCVFVIVGLTYFFYNRQLVYVDDLLGSAARLLQLKDETLGTKSRLYIDRVDLPVVMYYTNSPFIILDFNPEMGRIPQTLYEEDMILLAKRGRFEQGISEMRSNPKVMGEEADYVLYYYESDFQLDMEELKEIQKEMKAISEKLITSPNNIVLLNRLNVLTLEENALKEHMESQKGKIIHPVNLANITN